MLEETCLAESTNPGYSLFTGTVSSPLSVERSVPFPNPGAGYVSAGEANRPSDNGNHQTDNNIPQRLGLSEQLNCIQVFTDWT